jgi:hypothetical protein
MDGLAAYSSDEDDDAASSKSSSFLSPPSALQSTAIEGTSTIVPGVDILTQQRTSTSANVSSSSSLIFVKEDTKSPIPHTKRLCRKDNYEQPENKDLYNSTFLSQNHLPTPTLTKNEVQLFGWKNDYLSWNIPFNHTGDNTLDTDDSAATGPPPFSKFLQLSRNNNNTSSCWAAHLREQQEFHNPHFFHSVVEYFAIQEPMGTHMDPNAPKMPFPSKDSNENT